MKKQHPNRINVKICPKANKRLETFSEKVIHNADFKDKSLIKACLCAVLEAHNSEIGMVVGPIVTKLGLAMMISNDDKFVLSIIPRQGTHRLILEVEPQVEFGSSEFTEHILDVSWVLM